MPRIKRGLVEHVRPVSEALAKQLADELKSDRVSGQPLIDEQEFPTGKLRVTVIWDAWDRLSLEDRTSVILRAYELGEGRAYRDRIALASGLTFPEAYAAGMLPFQILLALRKGDPVRVEQARAAMIAEGASVLRGDPNYPALRFATEEEAEASRRRLIEALGPESEPIWVITRDMAGTFATWGPDTSESWSS
jgi:hypothetical protein